jgi:divalent metal cation (Fe/Co/Zn/Cd) transporter
VPTPPTLDRAEVDRLTRRGRRLAQITVAYNVVEGLVAIAAGASAGLVSLLGFGLDSGIESVTAVLVAIRLAARLRHAEPDETSERRTLRVVAILFFALAAYVVAEGARSLLTHERPTSSPVGLGVLVASVIAMPVLARAKTRVGAALGGDRLILADAAETRLCLLLSVSTLLGLGLFAVTGATWLDPAAGLVVAVLAVREGLEAWEGELVEDDED